MIELITGLSKLTFWSKLADFHGTLAMISLILFGAGIVLYFFSDNISFEHKEFLAFAPPILILIAFIIVSQMGTKLGDSSNKYLRLSVITALILSLIFVLVVAGEAV